MTQTTKKTINQDRGSNIWCLNLAWIFSLVPQLKKYTQYVLKLGTLVQIRCQTRLSTSSLLTGLDSMAWGPLSTTGEACPLSFFLENTLASTFSHRKSLWLSGTRQTAHFCPYGLPFRGISQMCTCRFFCLERSSSSSFDRVTVPPQWIVATTLSVADEDGGAPSTSYRRCSPSLR